MSATLPKHDESLCVQHPIPPLEGFGSLAVPTYRASTIVFETAKNYRERGQRGPDGYSYGLAGTPTTRVLEAQITALHHGARSIIVPSGQAAITMFMFAVLKAGDHVLVPDNVYPPARQFCRDVLAGYGVTADFYDPMDIAGLERLVRPQTRLVWIESPGSTTMEVSDIPAIVALARRHGILTGCDNTWASPLLLKPLDLGVDMVAEAITKYIGGHSDLLLGSMTFNAVELCATVRRTLSVLGIGVSPDDCALALRGIETMPVRLERVGRVGAEFAARLVAFDAVAAVHHPALPTAAGHDVWRRDFRGSSGVFSVKLKPCGLDDLDAALGALSVFTIGSSWGGTRSLVAPMQLGGDRSATPIDPDAVYLRISIGLENPGELWADLESLLTRVNELRQR